MVLVSTLTPLRFTYQLLTYTSRVLSFHACAFTGLPLAYCGSCAFLLLVVYRVRLSSHVFLNVGIVLNEEKRNRLAGVIACRQAALGGVGGSALVVPLTAVQASQIPTPTKKNKVLNQVRSSFEESKHFEG